MDKPTVSIIGNNQNLISLFSKYFKKKNITPVQYDPKNPSNYLIIFKEFSKEFQATEINSLLSKQNQQQKIAIIFQTSQFDTSIINFTYLENINKLISKNNLDCRILIAYDLITDANEPAISTLDRIIKDAIIHQQINISRNGNLRLFPLSFSDFFEGLSRSLFLKNTTNQIFYFGGNSITDIDFALNLKKALTKRNQTLEINQNFEPSLSLPDHENLIDTTSAVLNWIAIKDTETLIFEIINNYNTTKKPVNLIIKNPFILTIPQLSKPKLPCLFKINSVSRLIIIFIGISLSLFITSLTTFIILFYISLTQTNKAYTAFRQGNLDLSIQLTQSSSRKLKISESLYHLSSWPVKIITPDINSSIVYLINTTNHLHELMIGFQRIYTLGNSYYQDSISGTDVDIKNFSSTLTNNLESFQTELNQILLSNQRLDGENLHYVKTNLPDNLKTENINILKSQINQAITISKGLPLFFPEEKMTHYLVLVQDNNELRPSGGFLNTYALITFQKNKLIDLKIDSSFNLDSKLLGQVEPPQNINALTGNNHWNFSDSNYSPHFPETAKQISWFYEKITGQKVDGIIALNLSFFENYLNYSSPLILNNQQINADNLRSYLTNLSEDNSTDSLTLLTQTIFNDIRSQNINFATLTRSLLDTLASGDINIWFTNENAQNFIATTNLSGIIKNVPCPPQFSNASCLPETFYFNENNFSINKSNFYSNRRIEHIVNLNKTTIKHLITIDYSYPNPVPKSSNLQYQALIYLYAPLHLNLIDISLDGSIIDSEKIITSEKYGLKQIEFPLKFFLNQNHSLNINLESNHGFSSNGPLIGYSLAHFKQPGIKNTQTQVVFNYPELLTPKIISQPADISRQSLIFSSKPSSNTTYSVAFSNHTQ